MKVRRWVVALLGLWEFGDVVAPLVPGFGHVPAFIWNHVLVGLILMIAGVWGALTTQIGTARTLDWLAVVAGAWLVLASFILGNPIISPGLWNDVAVGVIVVILSSTSRLLLRRR
jgi:hypothetical protein